MTIFSLLREAIASAWATKVPSALVAVILGLGCFVSIATVGRSAANEQALAATLDTAGARILTVTDIRASGFITPLAVSAISSLSTVEAAVAVDGPTDTTNSVVGAGGAKVPMWTLHGELPSAVVIVRGRAPRPGEAVVSALAQSKLGLDEPIGSVTSGDLEIPIVGRYIAGAPLDDANAGLLVVVPPREQSVRELRVVISTIQDVSSTQKAVLDILEPPRDQVSIDAPAGMAELAKDATGILAKGGRSLMLLVLAVSAAIIAGLVWADTLVRRRELGRRRTLGVTRLDLTELVILRTAVAATIGAIGGTAAGVALNVSLGSTTPIEFSIAVGVLAVLTASLAALLPAILASRRDPVEVMRVP